MNQNSSKINIPIEYSSIEIVDLHKSLGMFTDHHLTFENHVDFISDNLFQLCLFVVINQVQTCLCSGDVADSLWPGSGILYHSLYNLWAESYS